MKHATHIAVVTITLALSGCASMNGNSKDPFEGFNRTMFTFNDKVDQVALKPAAQAYRAVVPGFVQIGVGNFFGNLGDVWTGVNNILQGKVGDGVSDFMRFAVNTVLGIGGVLDISSAAGIPKHKEDFGQTLGKWGVGSGPYVVLPLLGSSTVRDTAALPLDFKGDLWSYKDPVSVRNTGTGIRLLDARASVLDASDLIEGAALDRYEFVRDAYLQRRESRINDGEAPRGKGNSTAPGKNGGADKDGYVPAGPTPEPAVGTPAIKPAGKSETKPVGKPDAKSGLLESPQVPFAAEGGEPAVDMVAAAPTTAMTVDAVPAPATSDGRATRILVEIEPFIEIVDSTPVTGTYFSVR
ncbi:MAG: VacJ family lipoprotein [Herminiimonas sp.]|nr:VacJ family lipoprotein [Herminiimonas sp.]